MLENRQGERVPSVTFKTRNESDWIDRSSDDVFAGKTVVVFSLPGAFTPTCSSSHVPRFDQLASRFAASGVDEVICISVNDAFVMNEWKTSQHVENITFLPDGNGAFTEGMGMLVNKDDLGFGRRSWRYSMLVRDGIVEKMFIEPQEAGDPYGVSDADTMLEYIAPGSPKPLDVSVFSRPGCPHCARAKSLLRKSGVEFETLELNKDYSDRTLRAVSESLTVPQVFINGARIGGADELEAWLASAKLQAA
jgi:glutaredoxin-like protein